MENLLKDLLVRQIKEKHISVRALHSKIESLCSKSPEYEWISMSTLERRLLNPQKLTEKEYKLIELAVREIVSDSVWIQIKKQISEKSRYNYIQKIDKHINKSYALHGEMESIDIICKNNYCSEILSFYRNAPDFIKMWWLSNLETYLKLPDLTRASVICASYIGKKSKKNEIYNQKIIKFLDYFPLFQGFDYISDYSGDDLYILGKILEISSNILDLNTIPDVYWQNSVNKEIIDVNIDNQLEIRNEFEDSFCRLAESYRKSITDYKVTSKDFIHECCFILFLNKIEWLLAFSTTIFFFKLKRKEDRNNRERIPHDRGCTGFRFTEKELDYLCELIHVIEN